MNKILRNIYFLSLITAILTSCNGYQKLLKSSDNEHKFEMAVKYYDKEDYLKALPLFEELISIYKGTERAEKIYFYYCNCYYMTGDYYIASYHYKTYSKTYPNSDKAEEASFLSAYCEYLLSPNPSLDQMNTQKALEGFQLFINMYPKSVRIDSCNILIDNLRLKLEIKAYDISKLYYNIEDYQAAIISFKNLLKDFPDTDFKEEALYYIVKSSYKLAIGSIENKTKSRLQETIEEFNNFNITYPDSEYKRELLSIYENTIKKQQEFNNQNL